MGNVRPVEVEIANRGEGAATSPGLVLGTIGVLFGLCVAASVVTLLLLVLVPLVFIIPMLWLTRLEYRLNARYGEWVDEMAFVDDK